MLGSEARVHFDNLWGPITADAWKRLQTMVGTFDSIEGSQIGSSGYLARLAGLFAAELEVRASELDEVLLRVHSDFGSPADRESESQLLALAAETMSSTREGLDGYFKRHVGRYGLGIECSSGLDPTFAGLNAGVANGLRRYFWTLRNAPKRKPEPPGTSKDIGENATSRGRDRTFVDLQSDNALIPDLELFFANVQDGQCLDEKNQLEEVGSALLKEFLDYAERLLETEMVNRGMPLIRSMHWNDQRRLVVECADFSNRDLYELLHVLRPLILQRERASFKNAMGVLGKTFRGDPFAPLAKQIHRLYDRGAWGSHLQVFLGEQPLFDESLLMTWLNGTQYHTDAEQAAAWKRIESSLSESQARAFAITQLRGRVDAIQAAAEVAKFAVA